MTGLTWTRVAWFLCACLVLGWCFVHAESLDANAEKILRVHAQVP